MDTKHSGLGSVDMSKKVAKYYNNLHLALLRNDENATKIIIAANPEYATMLFPFCFHENSKFPILGDEVAIHTNVKRKHGIKGAQISTVSYCDIKQNKYQTTREGRVFGDFKKKDLIPKFFGSTPLHAALSLNFLADTISTILSCDPKAAGKQDFFGRYPIQLALDMKLDEKIFLLLLTTNLGAAIACGCEWTDVRRCLKKLNTQQFLQADSQGLYTVEHALRMNAPKDVLLFIVENGGLHSYTHHALQFALSSLNLISIDILLKFSPQMFLVEIGGSSPHDVMTPLDYCFLLLMGDSNNSEVDEKHPLVFILTRSNVGYAMARGVSWNIISNALESSPCEQFRIRDFNDKVALHYALCCRSPENITLAVLKKNTDAASMPLDGFSPLHLAIEHKHSVEVILALIKVYPKACNIPSKSDARTPLHLVFDLYKDQPSYQLDLFRVLHKHTDDTFLCGTSPHQSIRDWYASLGSLLGRYKLNQQMPVHNSATSRVYIATDLLCDDRSNNQVVVKMMRNRNEFEREILSRHATPGALNGIVVNVYGWHVPENEPFTVGDMKNEKQFSEKHSDFPYALVMERGTTSLWLAIASQRIAGYDLEKAIALFRQIVVKVAKLHDEGVIHCDLKPRNILIKDSEILLCDLDAAIEVNKVRVSNNKFSTAYCPPELARIVLADDGVVNKHSNQTEESEKPIDSRGNLVILPSFDVWSLGVVLYELCTGRHLFAQDISNDNLVSLDDKVRLCSWYCAPDSMLEAIPSIAARNLIRWCLHGKQEDRPSLKQILNHTLFRQNSSDCSEDCDEKQPMKYHFFVSHMQIEASGIVGTLSFMLKQLGCHCWRGKLKSIIFIFINDDCCYFFVLLCVVISIILQIFLCKSI